MVEWAKKKHDTIFKLSQLTGSYFTSSDSPPPRDFNMALRTNSWNVVPIYTSSLVRVKPPHFSFTSSTNLFAKDSYWKNSSYIYWYSKINKCYILLLTKSKHECYVKSYESQKILHFAKPNNWLVDVEWGWVKQGERARIGLASITTIISCCLLNGIFPIKC